MLSQVAHFLTLNATMLPNQPALIFKDKHFTWQELNEKSNQLANSLIDSGIKKGDVVAYLLKNCSESLLVWWATQKLGAIAMPINTFLLADEIATNIKQTQCKALFFGAEPAFIKKVEQITEWSESLELLVHCGLELDDDWTTSELATSELAASELTASASLKSVWFEDYLAKGSTTDVEAELNENDGSLLLFTSGSTGVPRAVMRTQRMVRDYAIMLALSLDTAKELDVFMTLSPLFHTAAFSMMTLAALLGRPFVLRNDFCEQDILRQIEVHQITQILFVPPILYSRLSAAHLGNKVFDNVRVAWGTGGTVTDGDIESMHRLFPNAKWRFSWGATETCAPTSALVLYDDLKKQPELGMCVGKANAFCEIKLQGADNMPVNVGKVGEAWVRSSMVFLGYYKSADVSRDTFTEDGFFKTGDLLRMDEQGFYYFAGRKKDMVKTGGENVFAQEVEKVVREYPGIHDCAMIGVHDPSFGEAVAIVAQLEGCEALDIDDFKQYNKRSLASFKKPRYLYYIDKLPLNSIGKLQKTELYKIKPEDFIKLY